MPHHPAGDSTPPPPSDLPAWVGSALADAGATPPFFEAVDRWLADALTRGDDLVTARLTVLWHDGAPARAKLTPGGWRRVRTGTLPSFDSLRDALDLEHQRVFDAMETHLQSALSEALGEGAELRFPWVTLFRAVVRQVEDPRREVSVEDARALSYDPTLEAGEEVGTALEGWTAPLEAGLLRALRTARPVALAEAPSRVAVPPEWCAEVDAALPCPATYMDKVPTRVSCRPPSALEVVKVIDTGEGVASLPFLQADASDVAGWLESAIEHVVYGAGLAYEEEKSHPLARLLPVAPEESFALIASLRRHEPLPRLGAGAPPRALRHHQAALDRLGLAAGPPMPAVAEGLRSLLAGSEPPDAFTEWATMPGADVLLGQSLDHCDTPYTAAPRLVALPDGRRSLQFYSENQGSWHLHVLLDAGDDPPVLRRVPGRDELTLFADSFSAAVLRILAFTV